MAHARRREFLDEVEGADEEKPVDEAMGVNRMHVKDEVFSIP